MPNLISLGFRVPNAKSGNWAGQPNHLAVVLNLTSGSDRRYNIFHHGKMCGVGGWEKILKAYLPVCILGWIGEGKDVVVVHIRQGIAVERIRGKTSRLG